MPYWFDGNNLIGQPVAVSSQQPQVLKSFLATLSGYRKSGGGRFLVYFDGDGFDRSMPPAGIRIRYSAPLSADDAIAESLHAIRRPSEVIVVTNDLQLQSRCRDAGAKVMNWQQFVSKMNARRNRQQMHSEQTVNVDEWMEYFGIEDSDQ